MDDDAIIGTLPADELVIWGESILAAMEYEERNKEDEN